MSLSEAAAYGERMAPVYDEFFPSYDEATIELLVELAGGGPALELGIGTGRIALPLAARGVPVHGIEASPAMVERLRAKPGGADIPVTFGDFASVSVEERFAVAYIVLNTFSALVTQAEQVGCFQSVAHHLAEEGLFVVELFVPEMTRFVHGQSLETVSVGVEEVQLYATRHDPVHQRVDVQHIILREDQTRLFPVQIRYAWPSELDLMAQLAGLRLRHRWSGWRREPFTAASKRHVSVYGR